MRSCTAERIDHRVDDEPLTANDVLLRHAEPGCELAMSRAAWRGLPRIRWCGALGSVVMFTCPRCSSTIAETTLTVVDGGHP